ncbi:cell wall-binding repeat-containing protein [Bacillus zanthoxyli]|nr:cell wall-binding repeat-containing protein [Bacillus zanthoxyli]
MRTLWKLTAAACISFGLWSAFGVQNTQAAEKDYVRLSGTDRLDTAVQISRTGWPTGLTSSEKSVILARADNPVDALSAASLAGAKDAPILLTYSGSLDNNVLDEMKRLGTKKIYVLGSSGAISQNVVATLVKNQLEVVRIDGADRFDTAKKINELSGASSSTTAIVVNGNTMVDALSATSESSINNIPIYLTTTNRLPISLPNTISKVIIYGSTGVVNADIESQLRAEGKVVTRINGADRYDTNVKALKASNISFKSTILARGISVKDNIEDYPDAVAAGGLAHKLHARIVLTHPTIAIPTVKDYLATDTLKTYVLGSAGTLTDTVLGSLGYKVPISKGPKYIQALTDTPLYDSRTGHLDEFALLSKGQALEVVKERSQDFWQVKWANTYAYVPKNKVKETTQQLFKNSNTSYKSTSKKIISIRDGIQVKDGVTNQQFASLKANHRYPVISKKNNSWLIDIGGRYGYVDSSQVKEDKGIPILMYHHVLDEKELGKNKNNSTTVTTEAFTQEMSYLSKQGFTTITTSDIEKYVKDEINLPAKTVAITFDDGLLSVRDNAYPVLKQYGMKATEYVITSRNNHPTEKFDGLGSNLQFFSKEDMENMTDVFNYQAHTNALHNLNSQRQSDVVTKPYATVKEDIQLNKNILNAHSFAYPFGQYNQQTIGILKELGFVSAVTTKAGYVNVGDDLYQLNRIGIDQQTTLSKFSSIVQ